MKTIKTLLITSLLTAQTALAGEQLPAGCYVAFDDPIQCYTPTQELDFTVFNDTAQSVALYGVAVTSVIQQLNAEYLDARTTINNCRIANVTLASQVSSCEDNLSVLNSENTDRISDYNSLVRDYNELLSDERKAKRTVKRLRLACGAKCAKIK